MNRQKNMEGKTCVITGANRGIGAEIAAGLVEKGARVVMACRRLEAAEETRQGILVSFPNAQIVCIQLDLASQQSIAVGASAIAEACPRIDVLIHNAGIAKQDRALSTEGHELTWAVNYLGPFLLTAYLMPILLRSAPARILVQSSMVYRWGRIDFDDLEGEDLYNIDKAYNQSKLANILFAQELARRVDAKLVQVHSIEPGMTATDFGADYTGFKGFMNRLWRPLMSSPKKAASTAVRLACEERVLPETGGHFVNGRSARLRKPATDKTIAFRLWMTTASILGWSWLSPTWGLPLDRHKVKISN